MSPHPMEREHTLTDRCWCNPVIEPGPGMDTVKHDLKK